VKTAAETRALIEQLNKEADKIDGNIKAVDDKIFTAVTDAVGLARMILDKVLR
jgi:hypothetical protein